MKKENILFDEHIAVVLVGNSKRLPNKHIKAVKENMRLIDFVVNNLKNMKLEVIVYSKYEFAVSTRFILDKSNWILPSIISILKNLNRGVFIFGGDMPFIQRKEIEKMMKYTSHSAVVPMWRNGYLEPLHAYYSPKIISFFEEELMGKKSSLHSAIKRCNDVIYLKAEKMNPLTFFNVNTLEDLNLMKNLLSSNF